MFDRDVFTVWCIYSGQRFPVKSPLSFEVPGRGVGRNSSVMDARSVMR